MTWPRNWVLLFHAIGFTIDCANGFIFCYTIGDAIGHSIKYIIDYANGKAIEYAIDYAIGKVNGQWLYFELCYWLCHLL